MLVRYLAVHAIEGSAMKVAFLLPIALAAGCTSRSSPPVVHVSQDVTSVVDGDKPIPAPPEMERRDIQNDEPPYLPLPK